MFGASAAKINILGPEKKKLTSIFLIPPEGGLDLVLTGRVPL